MNVTITLDPSHGALQLHVSRALDYPPGHVAQLLTQLTDQALTGHPTTPDVDPSEPRAPRAQTPDTADLVDRSARADQHVIRRRVLRMLDGGATQQQAADRLGVDPEQIRQWDDDACLDAHTDELADPHLTAPIKAVEW